MPRLKLETRIDRLGKLKAEIADLTAKANELRDSILDEVEEGEVEGKLFRVVVSPVSTNRVDYKGLLEELKPSKRTLNKYTTVSDSVRLSVSSR